MCPSLLTIVQGQTLLEGFSENNMTFSELVSTPIQFQRQRTTKGEIYEIICQLLAPRLSPPTIAIV